MIIGFLRRVARALAACVGIALAGFALVATAGDPVRDSDPSNPADAATGVRSAALRERLGLDDPLLVPAPAGDDAITYVEARWLRVFDAVSAAAPVLQAALPATERHPVDNTSAVLDAWLVDALAGRRAAVPGPLASRPSAPEARARVGGALATLDAAGDDVRVLAARGREAFAHGAFVIGAALRSDNPFRQALVRRLEEWVTRARGTPGTDYIVGSVPRDAGRWPSTFARDVYVPPRAWQDMMRSSWVQTAHELVGAATASLAAAARGDQQVATGEGNRRDDAAVRLRLIEHEATPWGALNVAFLMPALLDEDVYVRDLGLRFLASVSDMPFLGAARGIVGHALSADDQAWNDRVRERAASFWRRRAARYEVGAARGWWERWRATRLGAWCDALARGDLGDSVAVEPEAGVARMIATRLPVTITVMGLALTLLFCCGAPLGVSLARPGGRRRARAVEALLWCFHAMPEAWIGTMAVLLLASAECWRIFPTGGVWSSQVAAGLAAGTSAWWSPRVIGDGLWHLVLPVLTLVLPALAIVVRHSSIAATEAWGAPFVDALRARGLTDRQIARRHILRHTAAPVTALLATAMPALVGGSLIVERVFALDGMGSLAFAAALQRDVPLAMGVLVVTGVMTVLASLVADLLHSAADPRAGDT